MKQFFSQHKKGMFIQALYSASVLSLFIYVVLRVLFYEFPMTWAEEIFFFLKTVLASSFIIATATGGSAWVYRVFTKMKKA